MEIVRLSGDPLIQDSLNRSQATQLGQNLSHIDAYSGKEKVHMEKLICEELNAQGMTRTSVQEAPRHK